MRKFLWGGVAVKPSEITIAKGESCNLSFIIEPEGASYIGLYWQSDNEEVASVDQKGVVSGLSVGSATITLYVDSFRSSCEVTVTGGAVESYRIEPEALSLFIGQTRQLTYTYAPSDAEFDASLLEWSSSDDKVVTVDRNGNIEAVGTGKASAILSDGNVSGECEVSVVAEASAGDFFYSDGTWSPELDVTKECIGIVFFAGHHENDNTDYSGTGIGTVKCHGYVVALDDANGQSCFWGPQGTALGNYPVNEYDEKIPVELSNVENADWNGYAYTQNMKAAAEAAGGLAPEGGNVSVGFSVANPVEDGIAQATARSSESWAHDFSVSDGTLSFVVDAYEATAGEQQDRTTVITFEYPEAEAVSFTLVQTAPDPVAADELTFTLELVNDEFMSKTIRCTPSDPDATYVFEYKSQYEYDGTYADDFAKLVADDIAYFTEDTGFGPGRYRCHPGPYFFMPCAGRAGP